MAKSSFQVSNFMIDGPIEYVYSSGSRHWELPDGKLHRDDGPAFIALNGMQEWYQFDELHRDNGPAVTHKADGYQAWFQHGQRHRVDGPAIIFEDGHQEWFQDGMRHRLDGPAIIHADGYGVWWRHGLDIDDEVTDWITVNELPPWDQWDDDIKAIFLLKFS